MPPVLHRRASDWYEQHDLPIEAVQHALAVPDAELAARLIEPIALLVAYQGQLSTVLGWLHALPEAQMHAHPFLCVYHALLLVFTNQPEAAETRLREAEQGVQAGMSVGQAPTILGYVLAIRAVIARFSGHIPHAAYSRTPGAGSVAGRGGLSSRRCYGDRVPRVPDKRGCDTHSRT